MVTVENANMALMPALVEERIGTWSKTAHIIGVTLKLMLSLGLIHAAAEPPKRNKFNAVKGREE